MQLPNISDQIYESIKYYDEHVKAINTEYMDEVLSISEMGHFLNRTLLHD